MLESARLVRLADELEIRDLIARLAHVADDGDLDAYIELFTEDAAWGGGGQPMRRGRSQILDGARIRREQGLAGPGVNSRHVVTTTCLDLDLDAEQATARSVFHFYVAIDSGSPRLAALGVYRDTFRKTPQGWRLAERLLDGDAGSPSDSSD